MKLYMSGTLTLHLNIYWVAKWSEVNWLTIVDGYRVCVMWLKKILTVCSVSTRNNSYNLFIHLDEFKKNFWFFLHRVVVVTLRCAVAVRFTMCDSLSVVSLIILFPIIMKKPLGIDVFILAEFENRETDREKQSPQSAPFWALNA